MPETKTKIQRHSMRMHADDYNAMVYWARQFEMDRTEFMVAAMHHYIKWRNQDYDLPTAEIQRLNQLTDAMENLASNQAHLEKSVLNGLDAVLGIARGDNYLTDREDGRLDD